MNDTNAKNALAEPANFEASKFANHIGKGLVEFIPLACHKAVWCYLFDESKKHGWVLKEEKLNEKI